MSHHIGPEIEREFELERLVLFSDAVFAIAITLMVIEIRWPDIPYRSKGVDLGRLFEPAILQFLVFCLSFYFIGRLWVAHLSVFRLLKKYDRKLINLNLLLLFFVVIAPFTASGVFEHSRPWFALPMFLYMGNIAAVFFIHALICRYISGGNPLLSVRGKEDEKLYLFVQAKYVALGIAMTLIAMILAAILFPGNSAYSSLASLLLPVFVAMVTKKARKYKPINTELKTKRTILTLLHENDLPAMTAMAQEPETFRYIKKLRVMTDTEYQEFLRFKLEQIRLKTGYHWAVWLKRDGSFVGAVNLNPIGDTGRLQIGCQLKREFWGQGFATELTKRVLQFALREAGLTEVYGVFEKDNVVSRRLLGKLGFACIETKTEQGVEIETHRYPA
ncbi:MAG TPA: GNAT family N-acetyltransferase [Puia sp.]|nr:GNAT family N-acetyltransferase [Puia sp.]